MNIQELIGCKCGCKCPNMVPAFMPMCPMCQFGHHDGKKGNNPLCYPQGLKPTRCDLCGGTGGIESDSCTKCSGQGFYMIYTGRQ